VFESNINALQNTDESDNEAEVPRIVRRKRCRKANRPTPSKNLPEPEKSLSHQELHKAQLEDSDICYVINLISSEARKPTWSDIADRCAVIKFWISRWNLLSIQGGLLCIKWEYSENDVKWPICIPSEKGAQVLWY
jgi:hypothetical protein